MPIYEYRCTSCGHELEALQRFADPPMTVCPSCHTGSLVKLLSAAGFQLKGSGWYATDFKGSGGKPAAAKDSGDAKPDAKSETKGESKGESKSETAGAAKPGAEKGSKGETSGSGSASATGATPAST